ncbi:hypothetical protein MKZ38_001917 [Zalerion maritima]|uniref:WIBG Mago-binding domain-containing protein n=1 Tax=Zalerion maritima TaxID=339359 RepID=A0AAD5WST1_9PEZI|nr:hypothetical protein MKZ38_001917 [Zalerion maritima]
MEHVQPTTSGIITTDNGERHIPESKRADGSTRRAIKIRPGYQPPEDVAKFRIKSQQEQNGRPRGIPGAEGLKDNPETSAASNKNAKRREARKKAKATATGAIEELAIESDRVAGEDKADPVDPAVEKERKARNIRKKLKQARELKSRKEGGGALLPEQLEKVIKINQLIHELEALGLDDASEETKNMEVAEAKDESVPSPA